MNTRIKRTLSIAVTAVMAFPPVSPAAVEQAPVGLTVLQAVAMAAAKNPDLKAEAITPLINRANIEKNRGIYDPHLTAGGSYTGRFGGSGPAAVGTGDKGDLAVGVSRLLPTGGTITASTQSGYTGGIPATAGGGTREWQSTAGVTLTQPLLKGFGRDVTELGIEIAKEGAAGAADRYRSLLTDTVASVMTEYHGLFAARQELESKKVSAELAKKVLAETKAKVQAGVMAAMEISSAEFGLAQRQKDLIEAERIVRDEESKLKILIGLDSSAELIPLDVPSRNEVQEQEKTAVAAAVATRGDLKVLESTLKANELQEKLAKNRLLPDLSATAGTGLVGSGSNPASGYGGMGDGRGYWSAGVQLDIPLGNTAARNDYRMTSLRSDQIRTEIESLKRKIAADVQADIRGMKSAYAQIEAGDKAFRFAEEKLNAYMKKHQVGLSTTKDVLDAEEDLAAARAGQIQALTGYADAVTKLWRDTGEILERQGIKVTAG